MLDFNNTDSIHYLSCSRNVEENDHHTEQASGNSPVSSTSGTQMHIAEHVPLATTIKKETSTTS